MEPPEPLLLYNVILGFDLQFYIVALILLILLCLSALVSGSEVAFFSISPKQHDDLKNEDTKMSRKILSLLAKPEKLLATILVANNIINIAIVILSTFVMNDILEGSSLSTIAKLVLELGVATFLILLFGEVLPKIYATSNNLKFSSIMSSPIAWISKIFYPIIALLLSSSALTDRLVKKKPKDFNFDDLEQAMELTMENADEDEQKILEGIVKFGNINVKQIMTPRTDTVCFSLDKPFDELIADFVETGYSRIPIYEETFDQVKGILYLKDLLPYIGEKDFAWQEVLREPMYAPENKMIDDMLKDFQEVKMHLAIVVDEYGGSSGIVTLEDVIEEIVGEITDEFDNDNINFTEIDKDNYVFEGKTPLVDLYRIMDFDGAPFEKAKGESDTIAGFVIELAEKIPLKGEKIKFNNFTFTVAAADKRKIKQVNVCRIEEEE